MAGTGTGAPVRVSTVTKCTFAAARAMIRKLRLFALLPQRARDVMYERLVPDQVRAAVGAAFFVLSVVYVV